MWAVSNATDAKPWFPFIVAPDSLFAQMGGGYNACRFNSWPQTKKAFPVALQIALVPGVPDGPFENRRLKPRRNLRAPAPAHQLPQAPKRTSEPTRSAK